MMSSVFYSVRHRILFSFFEGSLESESCFALIKFSVFHVFKKLQRFWNWPVPPRRRWRIETSDIFNFLMANVSQIFVDQFHSPFVKLLKVVRRVGDLIWLVTQPFNNVFDTSEKLLFFF